MRDEVAGEGWAGIIAWNEVALEDVAFFADQVDGAGDGFGPVFDDGVVVDTAPDVGEGSAGCAGEFVAGDGFELEESSCGTAIDDEIEAVSVDALEGVEEVVGAVDDRATGAHVD